MAIHMTTTMASDPEKYLNLAGSHPDFETVLAACGNDYDRLGVALDMGLSGQDIVANHLAELDELNS